MLYIVSGLPRSGTSMLMRMLDSGGIDVVTDNRRMPDKDNPGGYYEYEPVKTMADDNSFIHELEDKAVKVVSHLLKFLPPEKSYKVVFMLRPLEEILQSQKKMLERSGDVFSEQVQKSLTKKFKNHLYDIRLWLARQPRFECLFVPYPEVIADPLLYSQKIAAFLNAACDAQEMASVVAPELYRNQMNNENKTNSGA